MFVSGVVRFVPVVVSVPRRADYSMGAGCRHVLALFIIRKALGRTVTVPIGIYDWYIMATWIRTISSQVES